MSLICDYCHHFTSLAKGAKMERCDEDDWETICPKCLKIREKEKEKKK
jgi:hypothetical protein